MQIKKFEAPNMNEALKQIKREFGPEAVILSVKKIESGKGIFGFSKGTGIEVSAATDSVPIQRNRAGQQNGVDRYRKYLNVSVPAAPVVNKNNFLSSLINSAKKNDRDNQPTFKSNFSPKKEIKGLYNSYCQLLEQDVDETVCIELMKGVRRIATSNMSLFNKGFKACLNQVLEQSGIISGRVKIIKEKPKLVAIIGSTGVGKTTTIAKLAASAKIREASKRVGLITLDNNRIGAVEQLRVYARIAGLPLKVALNRNELKKYIDDSTDYDLVFIDTPGINQFNKTHINGLKEIFPKSHDIEFHLALSATTSDKTLKEILENFKDFNPQKLIFTKLDECMTYGAILNQMFRSKIPVSYLTTGQQIPEDIEAACVPSLVDMMFSDKSDRNYLTGSPEMLAQKLTKFEMMVSGFDYDAAIHQDTYKLENTA